MVMGNVRRPLLALALLDIPLQWDFNLGYREDAAALSAVGGFSISLTMLALAGLYALWVAELLTRRASTLRPYRRIAAPLFLYVLFVSLSALVASDRILSLYQFVPIAQSLLLFIYVAFTLKTARDTRFVVLLLMIGLLFEGALIIATDRLGIDLSALGFKSHSRVDAESAFNSYRLAGTVGSPNATASYLAFLLPLALVLQSAPVSKITRRIALMAFGVGVVALVLTFSRGGWLAFGISLVVLLIVAVRRRAISLRVPLAAVLATIALAIPFRDAISNRLLGDDAGSAESRVTLLELTLPMIRDHPWLGVGLNNYGVALPNYAGPEFTGDWLSTVHNRFALTWAETGLGALIAFVIFLLATLRQGFRLGRSDDGLVARIGLALAAGLVGQLVHMNVEIFAGRAQIELLFLVAGVISAMSAQAEWRRRQPPVAGA
jgi:putative inorganic carbon (hco3(-)) transporter